MKVTPEFVKEILGRITLEQNEVRIIAVRPTSNPTKVQLVFAEELDRPSHNKANKVHKFMQEDEPAFSSNNIQPVWYTAPITAVEKYFPQAYAGAQEAIEKGDYVELNISNPALAGNKLAIEVREGFVANKQHLNRGLEASAKQDGNGNYLLKEGKLIFSDINIVFAEDRENVFIAHDTMTPNFEDGSFTTTQSMDREEQEADNKAKQAQESQKALDEA